MGTVDDDIGSARARATAAENRMRAQTMVWAEAEHRLKTTLAIITGWAITLEERWDQLSADHRREGASVIRRASEELAVQANGMLGNARAELLSLDQEPVRTDLGVAVGVSTGLFAGMGGHVIDAVMPAKPIVVDVDPAALQHVLRHLLENAVKYSPIGSCVRVSVTAVGHEAVIEVSDEGCGVSDGVDLFGAFQRGPGSEALPGAGLGLYIVRNLVGAMGGDVSARANDDRGSTFTVRLPVARRATTVNGSHEVRTKVPYPTAAGGATPRS